MKVCQTLIFLVLTLPGPSTVLVAAGGHPVFTGTEGGNISVHCSFFFSGIRKLFCKQDCEESILIETAKDRATTGRFSIEYSKKNYLSHHVHVSITKLTKSDSGRYKCGVDRFLLPNSHDVLEIIVEDAPTTSEPEGTRQPFPSEVQSASTPPAPQSQSSSLRSFTSSSSSAEIPTHCVQQQMEGTATPAAGAPLYVGLIVLAKIILLSLAVLYSCRRRAREHRESPVEAEYASVSKTNKTTQSRPPASVYTYAKYTKPEEGQSDDDYSLVGPIGISAASPQHKVSLCS
ncbi:CMRF35-like molecule 9 isoform X3 [Eleginops maclovinus]|uniref:CMRF35-like molecule 9 isoform X3 n=1 Tax=Eleginops maclovinus TaxID=56733 RepID=UPI0030805686